MQFPHIWRRPRYFSGPESNVYHFMLAFLHSFCYVAHSQGCRDILQAKHSAGARAGDKPESAQTLSQLMVAESRSGSEAKARGKPSGAASRGGRGVAYGRRGLPLKAAEGWPRDPARLAPAPPLRPFSTHRTPPEYSGIAPAPGRSWPPSAPARPPLPRCRRQGRPDPATANTAPERKNGGASWQQRRRGSGDGISRQRDRATKKQR